MAAPCVTRFLSPIC